MTRVTRISKDRMQPGSRVVRPSEYPVRLNTLSVIECAALEWQQYNDGGEPWVKTMTSGSIRPSEKLMT